MEDKPGLMTEAEIADLLEKGHQPGLVLVKTRRPNDLGLPGCWFGGLPTLPAHVDWPVFTSAENDLTIPMHFLCQIDLAQVPQFEGRPEMPTSGTLFFFVDPVFAPVEDFTDAGRMIYVPQDVSACPERAVPEGLPVNIHDFNRYSFAGAYVENPTKGYPRWNFTFMRFDGINDLVSDNQRFRDSALDKNVTAWEAVQEATESLRGPLKARPENKPPRIAEYFGCHSMLTGYALPRRISEELPFSLEAKVEDYVPLLVVDYDTDFLFRLGHSDRVRCP